MKDSTHVDRKPGKKPFKLWKRPELEMQTTTLWEYPSQHYGLGEQGSKHYVGATPSWVIWNLLQRYTREGDTVLDPMCGSGTTLDVAKDLGRTGVGYDLVPSRPEIGQADARSIPMKNDKADFIFIDPPYSTHIEYSEDPRCIGKLDANSRAYYRAMENVFNECHRILRSGRYLALYVSDSYKKGKPFMPLGFELFAILARKFEPVDIICVTRHNRKLKRNHWHTAAVEGNFFLRGFNYLFIFKKV
jgi:DNA modification methylase